MPPNPRNPELARAILYAKEHGSISNREFRQLFTLSHELARNELNALVRRGLVHTEGRGRSLRYVLGKPKASTDS